MVSFRLHEPIDIPHAQQVSSYPPLSKVVYFFFRKDTARLYFPCDSAHSFARQIKEVPFDK